MIVDQTTGKIAYHSYVITEEGGLDYIQYDFDGSILFRRPVRNPILTDTSQA